MRLRFFKNTARAADTTNVEHNLTSTTEGTDTPSGTIQMDVDPQAQADLLLNLCMDPARREPISWRYHHARLEDKITALGTRHAMAGQNP